ncbi:hypothetical protein C5F47_06030 [Nitrosopumilus cobalaminigenes]|uniref:Uncharacterized protein n=1 Tax=Nitrosopumilus cobalaminigenes TaxID=1470066 RepID=A0A7D5R0I3_9ARCH|nr:hypothetical protein [Nitrosopumilus cobalaminigenes]QLH03138.1 hypothetical protein C5F47_06030 [Nitrosopumilus cobalaminigenes]
MNKQSIGIFLIVLGCVLVTTGLMVVLTSTNYAQTTNAESSENIRPIEFTTLEYVSGDPENPTKIQLKVVFSTLYDFAVNNKIDYVFQAKVSGPEAIERILIFFMIPKGDYSGINESNIIATFEQEKEEDSAVELFEKGSMNDGSILFERTGFITFPIEHGLSLYPITIGTHGEFAPLDKMENIVEIKPSTVIKNAEANEMIVESFSQQNIFSIQQIGLAVLGLSGVPFGIGTSLILSVKNQKHIELVMDDLASKIVEKVNNSKNF